MRKITVVLLLALLFTAMMATSTSAFAQVTSAAIDTPLEVQGDYRSVLAGWENEGYANTSSFSTVISPSAFTVSTLQDSSLSNGYGQAVFALTSAEDATFVVHVPSEGLYEFAVDFFPTTSDYLDLELQIEINGALPFSEASQIILYKEWIQIGGFSTDRYGNDFFGEQSMSTNWVTQSFYDPMGLFASPLVFYLHAGDNDIRLIANKGEMLLGNVTVSGQQDYLSYEEYASGATLSSGEVLITTEAEIPSAKYDSGIQAGVSLTPLVTPFSISEQKLNILNGASMSTERQKVSYDVMVPAEGDYYLTFKVKQSTVTNSAVYRTLSINGEVPFEEALTIPFGYDTKWQNVTLGGDTPWLIHLQEGVNTISLSVCLDPYREAYYTIEDVLTYVNDLNLEIKKLTGNQLDENRDWLIEDYIPTISSDLYAAANALQAVYDDLTAMSPNGKLSETQSFVNLAIRNLTLLAENPNEIPKNISLISSSSSSIASTLGNAVRILLFSALDIDKFYVHTDVDIEKANAGFFTRMWVNIRRFFLSFFNQSYVDQADPDELDVWVNRSKPYVDLIQKMADEDFTTATGIKVKVSVMAAEGKLILANSAGTNPDVALGVSSWLPYDLAIRGAILDLSTFQSDPLFAETLNLFADQTLIPLMYDNGLYGLPDTENFYVLFYRSDIMSSLGIEVPTTWDDVAQMMPVLRRYGMNFYLPLSSATSLKSFDSTLPFLFQYGSDVYSSDGFTVDLSNEASVSALETMTELYTIYSMETTVTSFYNEFRLGLTPIGVGDFGMYITLLNAATDIQGLWKIALLPGVMQEDNTIDRSAPGAQTANMIFKNTDKPEESWSFLRWWASTETQTRFSGLLLSTMGKEFLWNSANQSAFASLNINDDDLAIILEQWSSLREIPKVPGSYQVELEISNLWNAVVLDRENLRVLLNDGIIRMNKEIAKKMAEFSYMDKSGNILKEYVLANPSQIEEWKAGGLS